VSVPRRYDAFLLLLKQPGIMSGKPALGQDIIAVLVVLCSFMPGGCLSPLCHVPAGAARLCCCLNSQKLSGKPTLGQDARAVIFVLQCFKARRLAISFVTFPRQYGTFAFLFKQQEVMSGKPTLGQDTSAVMFVFSAFRQDGWLSPSFLSLPVRHVCVADQAAISYVGQGDTGPKYWCCFVGFQCFWAGRRAVSIVFVLDDTVHC
jgi:hypothetical protein